MQPSPICLDNLRLVEVSRATVDTVAHQFETSELVGAWRWSGTNVPVNNFTLRIVSAASEKTATAHVLVFCAAQFTGNGSTGTQYGGGFLVRVDVARLKSSSSLENTQTVVLDSSFVVKDVDVMASGNTERIAVGGIRLGQWEVLLYQYDSASNMLNPLFTNASASLRAELSCWPSSSSSGTVITGCASCLSVEKIRFFANFSLVLAISTGPKENAQTFLVWVRPLSDGVGMTGVAAPMGGICVWAVVTRDAKGVLGLREAAGSAVLQTSLPSFFAVLIPTTEEQSTATAMEVDATTQLVYVALSRPSGSHKASCPRQGELDLIRLPHYRKDKLGLHRLPQDRSRDDCRSGDVTRESNAVCLAGSRF